MNLDWQRIVLNIRQAGLPVSQLAKRVGMDAMTLGHYVRGECKEPRWSQAVALLDVHSDVCPDRHRLDALLISAPQIVDKPLVDNCTLAAIYSESA